MNGLGDKAKEVAIEHVKQKAARDILNGIKEWRSNRISTAKKRWLFELIQNAADTAKARQNNTLKIEIKETDSSITFKHNGGYFTLDEISAVIYGGSTKPYAPESEYIGRFGTGFLVTHITSRRVKITGYVKENAGQTYKFKMNINREGNEEKNISQSIEECFQQLNESTPYPNEVELYTEFTYDLNDDLGRDATKTGIEELKKNLPFLLAFNDIVQEIVINGERFGKRIENTSKENNIQFIRIEGDHSNFPIVIKKDANHEIVVAIAIKDNEVIGLEKLPKIYVGMPLIETAEYMKIPFVMSSINFEPTKERDALSSENEINKELLSRAFELYKELIKEFSKLENIKGLFRTVDIQLISDEWTSQNPLWRIFNENITKVFTQIIGEIPLIETFEGKKEIKNTKFLTYGDIDKLEDNLKFEVFAKFYSLANQINKNIPMDYEINNWVEIAEKLNKIDVFSDLISLYSIENMRNELVNFVEKDKTYPTFENFAKNFSIKDPKRFLQSLFEMFDELYQKGIISNSFIDSLLLDQAGIIGKLTRDGGQLHIDDSVPEDLKNILHMIGLKIRNELLDKDFAKYKIVTDYVRDKMNTDGALDKVIKDKALRPTEDMLKKDAWDERIGGWVNLFRWCVQNKKLTIGFPVITKDKKVQDLQRVDDETHIIPFKYMGIEEKYEDIYPDNRIIHRKYFEIENPEEILDSLGNYRTFVRKLPIYKNTLTLGYNKLESILNEKSAISKVDHKIETNQAIISILPFWSDVVGKISEYQERGKLLFEFVVNYLINHDGSWKEKASVNCSCKDKSHEIIPAHWLASLKSDVWVPYKTVENNEEKIVRREAGKDSIENLFTPEEIKELIKSNPDNITTLLPHFGFDELDLKITLHSIEKDKPEQNIREELSKLVGLTDVLEYVPNLPDIAARNPDAFKEAMEKLRESLESEATKDENKRIGENVEKIIAKILRDKGFTVKPIYRGGDLEIWPEEEGWDGGLIEIESYLLEVKFTSGGRVHLSKPQSEMARSKEGNYLILIVENVGNLRKRLKEMDENSISDDIITDVEKNSKVVEDIYTKLGAFPSPDEIEPDIHGYWVKRKLWKDKNDVIKWLKQEFGDSV